MKLFETIRQTLHAQTLLRPGDTLVLGVSGGADSVALLEIFDRLRPEMGLTLIAGHVNHGLREGADADQAFVAELCRHKGLGFHASRVSIPKKNGDSLEQAARNKRFEALCRIVRRYRADALVLAHHRDDLAETVLMRLLRGTGLQGLQAILPKRDINGIRVIRPLLDVSRDQIRTFLTVENISFREDPSNSDQQFFRNKIRHRLLPELARDYNTNITEVLAGLAEIAGLDYEFLTQTAARHLKQITVKHTTTAIQLSRKKLSRRHPALQRLILRLALAYLCGHTRGLTLKHMHMMEETLRQTVPPLKPRAAIRIDLPDGVTARISAAQIILRQSRG